MFYYLHYIYNYLFSQELLQSKDEGLNLLSATIQYGEQLQVGTSPEGWETVQVMLQNLQSTFDKIFDGASSLERSLRSTQFSWSEFDDSFQRLQGWIASCSSNFYESPKLVATLEEKKSLLRLYKVNLYLLFKSVIFPPLILIINL